jgi:hypothetical protein
MHCFCIAHRFRLIIDACSCRNEVELRALDTQSARTCGLIVPREGKNFCVFYGTRIYIVVFT